MLTEYAIDICLTKIKNEIYPKQNTNLPQSLNDSAHFCEQLHSIGSISDLCVSNTVVPALGGPRRERPPAVYGHVINVPTHFNVKLPAIGGHLPNADADSHLLVVRTCNNGQCKQIQRFWRSFQP